MLVRCKVALSPLNFTHANDSKREEDVPMFFGQERKKFVLEFKLGKSAVPSIVSVEKYLNSEVR